MGRKTENSMKASAKSCQPNDIAIPLTTATSNLPTIIIKFLVTEPNFQQFQHYLYLSYTHTHTQNNLNVILNSFLENLRLH